MVAAVSNESAHFIEWEMPVAKGLQYQALWLEWQGDTTEPRSPATDDAGVSSFSKIAGRR